MTTLPTSADFTTTPGSHLAMRTSLAQQRDYLAGLLGADGLPATALATLGSLAGQYIAKTGAYTISTGDRGKVIDASGTWTLSLPAAAAAGSGFALLVKNGGSGVITLDPSGAELVDGSATLALSAGRAVLLSCTGTAWAKVFHSENLLGTVSQSGGRPDRGGVRARQQRQRELHQVRRRHDDLLPYVQCWQHCCGRGGHIRQPLSVP